MVDSQVDEGRYTFLVEWFDTQAQMVRQYMLVYHAVDDTMEMIDLKQRRAFLKRCSYPSVKLSDLFIGSQINVYARQLKVLDYGDGWTRSKLSSKQTRHLVVVKPNAYQSIGRVVDHIYGQRLAVTKMRMVRLSQREAANIFGGADANEFSMGPLVAMEVVGSNVREGLSSFIEQEKMVYVAPQERAEEQCGMLLDNPTVPTTAQFDNCTVCCVRPHAVTAGSLGAIIDSIIRNGFEISALQMFNLDRQCADEFMEVYRGVLPQYNAMCEQMTTGCSVAMELRGANVAQRFREWCGPVDPEVARLIRPDSLRAEFGEDTVKNAVHCTDLPEDGVLESEYFFSILQKNESISFNRVPTVSSFTSFKY
jgi:nucleoside-diphosphate kinase